MSDRVFNLPEYLLRLRLHVEKFAKEELDKQHGKALVGIVPFTLEHREQRNNDWRAVVPAGTTAEDINYKASACSLIASHLMVGDTLTLITSDKTRMIRAVCVMGDGKGPAMCAVIDEFYLPSWSRGDIPK